MPSLSELQDERQLKIAEMEAIAEVVAKENREMTEDERTKVDEDLTATDNLTTLILNREADLERAEKVKAAAQKAKESTGRKTIPGEPRDYATAGDREPWERAIVQGMRGFKDKRAAYESGQWLLWQLTGNERAKQYCRDHGIGWEQRALGGTNPAQGAVLAPTPLLNTMIELRENYGVARQLCQVIQMGSDSLSIPRRTSGTTAYLVGDNTEITESTPGTDQVTLNARKWGTLVKISSEISEDAIIGIADWVAREIASAFAAKEDTSFIDGDGTSTYGGVYGWRTKIIDGNHSVGAVDAATNHDTFPEIDADDLGKLLAVVPQYALQGAAWLVSPAAKALVFDALRAAGAGEGGGGSMTEGYVDRYLGFPVYVSVSMPNGAATDYSNVAMIGFGNWAMGAALGSRRDIRLAVDSSRYIEYDQIAVVATTRWDLAVHGLGDTSNAGPIVALIGE